ncbi:MAG: tRNA (adenosine(37)-N6)-threonylcarbamoyltransferase complex dimerization subunit type 1 TsaB [Candidatus Omnitrophica bacterium]|nr:tRNA (adenosine(37)-N6)-threonylcarbamoyltransferase complex dimerization subunit type 1 TsaB [Candidatus Omnitrophota bacterium]
MKILAYDTSNKFLSVAILDEEELLSNFHKDIGINHSSMLIPTIDKTLKHAHLKLKNIDAIALSIGPGSFTGLRIGVSTAKALSLVTDIPVIGVPSLDVIAYNYIEKEGYISPVLDAKKNKVYSVIYESSSGEISRISEYLLVDVDNLLERLKGPTLFFGDGLSLYGEYMAKNCPLIKFSKNTDWYPRAEIVGKLGLQKIKKGYREDIDKLVPMYLHPKECNIRIKE